MLPSSITVKGLCLFLLLCIPVRIAISIILRQYGHVPFNKVEHKVEHTNKESEEQQPVKDLKQTKPFTLLQFAGVLYLLLAVAMAGLFITNGRRTGREVFGGKIWWNSHRSVHALFYGVFAILALLNKPFAWGFLLGDALYGLIVFIIHHFL